MKIKKFEDNYFKPLTFTITLETEQELQELEFVTRIGKFCPNLYKLHELLNHQLQVYDIKKIPIERHYNHE